MAFAALILFTLLWALAWAGLLDALPPVKRRIKELFFNFQRPQGLNSAHFHTH